MVWLPPNWGAYTPVVAVLARLPHSSWVDCSGKPLVWSARRVDRVQPVRPGEVVAGEGRVPEVVAGAADLRGRVERRYQRRAQRHVRIGAEVADREQVERPAQASTDRPPSWRCRTPARVRRVRRGSPRPRRGCRGWRRDRRSGDRGRTARRDGRPPSSRCRPREPSGPRASPAEVAAETGLARVRRVLVGDRERRPHERVASRLRHHRAAPRSIGLDAGLAVVRVARRALVNVAIGEVMVIGCVPGRRKSSRVVPKSATRGGRKRCGRREGGGARTRLSMSSSPSRGLVDQRVVDRR